MYLKCQSVFKYETRRKSQNSELYKEKILQINYPKLEDIQGEAMSLCGPVATQIKKY